MAEAPGKIRVDKWLWYARFFKTRSLATKLVSGGHLRLNGERIEKPAHSVAPGDVLTFPQGRQAPEAQALYEDLTPPEERDKPVERAGERPTKKDRRALDAFRQLDEE